MKPNGCSGWYPRMARAQAPCYCEGRSRSEVLPTSSATPRISPKKRLPTTMNKANTRITHLKCAAELLTIHTGPEPIRLAPVRVLRSRRVGRAGACQGINVMPNRYGSRRSGYHGMRSVPGPGVKHLRRCPSTRKTKGEIAACDFVASDPALARGASTPFPVNPPNP